MSRARAGSGGEAETTGASTPLRTMVAALAATEAGRRFGLHGVRTAADLRASVPAMDAAQHRQEVEARLGFAVDDSSPRELVGARERPRVVGCWRELFARAGRERPLPEVTGLLRRRDDDPEIDRILARDLEAVSGAAPVRIAVAAGRGAGEPGAIIDELVRWRGDTLVLPSLSTCAWLEGHLRRPLERAVTSLRWIFVEHDLEHRVRTRVPIIHVGWTHAAGRLGVPAVRPPRGSVCLAGDSCHLELLPESDPQADPRQRVLADAIDPARAVMGERYELVVSSELGFLRLRTGEHVRVVGFSPPDHLVRHGQRSPRPRVVRLPPPPGDLRLEGVTLAGAWLTSAVRQAFRPEEPALVAAEIGVDPDAVDANARREPTRSLHDPFAETELAGARHGAVRHDRRPLALFVRVELQGDADPRITARLSERIDASLRARSPAYAYLRGADELWEPRVLIARFGTARHGRETRLAALAGRVEVPPVRVRAAG